MLGAVPRQRTPHCLLAGITYPAWKAYAAKAFSIIARMWEPNDNMVDASEITADRPCECMYARDAWEAIIDKADG